MHMGINMATTHQDLAEGSPSTAVENSSCKNKSKGTKKSAWKSCMLQDENYLNSRAVGKLPNKLRNIN